MLYCIKAVNFIKIKGHYFTASMIPPTKDSPGKKMKLK